VLRPAGTPAGRAVSVIVILAPWDFHSIATLPGGQAKSMDHSYHALTKQSPECSP